MPDSLVPTLQQIGQQLSLSPQARAQIQQAQGPGIYNAQIQSQDPWWMHAIKSMFGDPGLSPMGMSALTPEAEVLFSNIAARNTLQHSTGLQGAKGILEDGKIEAGGFQRKVLDWGSQERPYLSGRNAGYTTPGPSFSRAQRYPDAVTFEFPSESIQGRPGQGLVGQKPQRFEYETVTNSPVDVSKAKRIFINRGRIAQQMDVDPTHTKVQQEVDKIRAAASKYNIPVIDGNSEQELLQYRIKYPQYP